MAATLDAMWYFQPWQATVVIIAAFNAGASALQGMLTMPMLMLEDVPAQFEGAQVGYLLHASEFIFPPLNAFCTLSYIAMSTIAYRYRNSSLPIATPTSTLAAAKFPLLLASLALHISATVYTLTIMSKPNNKMRSLAAQLKDAAAQKEEKLHVQKTQEFRATQKTWQNLSYVRGVIMTGSAVTGMVALLTRA